MEKYSDPSLENNDCYKYAAIRNILYSKGKCTEVMVSYEPCYAMMTEWWKQLYGESEGKDNKGLFPASVDLLHGPALHGTVSPGWPPASCLRRWCSWTSPKQQIILGEDPADVDGLNYLAGQTMDFVNEKAYEGTVLAHNDGGVPNLW